MTTTIYPPASLRAVRRSLAVAFVAAATLVPAAIPAADDAALPPAVTVREERGVYSVNARFLVRQQPSVALAVLTDYERIPQFMPGVETSVVLERGPERAVISQDAVSRFMMFKKRVHLVLEIVETPHALQFRDRAGESFKRYEGTWCVTTVDEGARVSYELTAQPAFDVPDFVLKRLLKRDSAQMIDGLRREIAARAAGDGQSAR